jgi:transposase
MEANWLKEELAKGRSIEAIARGSGLSASTVAYWVNKHGLRSRHAGRHAARGGIPEATLRTMVEEGRPIRGMAEALGVSYTTVRHWLRRYGLATPRALKLAASAPARAAGLTEAVIPCPVHGETVHARRGDGALRCVLCRSDAVARRRREVKATLVREAGGKCVRCGYAGAPAALHFHHVDRATKAFALGRDGVTRSLAKAREEAAKCVLLCATCHAEVESRGERLPFPPHLPMTGAEGIARGPSPDGRG